MGGHGEYRDSYALEKTVDSRGGPLLKMADKEKRHEKQDLVYNVTDNPPIHLTILFAFQQALLSLANQLALSLMVADAVCGADNNLFRTKLLSSTMFMDGITSLCMVLFGVRLPLFQGAAFEYVVPLMALQTLDVGRCSVPNATGQFHIPIDLKALNKRAHHHRYILLQLEGSLMIAGFIHFLIGATGLVGVLLRVIGPITIVPTILLIGLYMTRAAVRFVQVQWGIGILTAALSIISSLYLSRVKMPLPIWTKEKGFHIIRYPLHQVFSILIAILFGWMLSAILTMCGVFTDNPDDPGYAARTDARAGIIEESTWFYFPYPGQFGPPSISASVLVGFLVATLISILDSIGDYYACAKMCNVPPPPSHAVNRGLAIEGLCTFFSGALGCGHATSTYGGNVGAIGITRVGSRTVFIGVAIIYIVFGLVGKFSAVFITIPSPVLGGALITMFGMFIGVVLSNLQFIPLTSTRNMAIIGTSILFGLMVPYWVETNPNGLQTGNEEVDRVLRMILGNANLSGAVLACFLDNTVPGTKEERGILAWQGVVSKKSDPQTQAATEDYTEGYEIYEPLIPKKFRSSQILKFLPFMPDPSNPHEASVENGIAGKETFESTPL
ncbi:hypothetical protein ScPMuIL_017608 [Solemya velum]